MFVEKTSLSKLIPLQIQDKFIFRKGVLMQVFEIFVFIQISEIYFFTSLHKMFYEEYTIFSEKTRSNILCKQ